MIDLNTKVCVCNNLTAGDIAKCIKENNFSSLEELLENEVCPMADKCESCKDEGFNNDGINIPLVFAMVKKGQL
ncbi:(2Fe-2S)-binding protein [bacterium]|jgi:bacterioferritin-associated ferredoxin|nr:(2Fe-2S)-binding protein [bacterium]MBU1433806.1 (2Fe-2S)-binding protein [bacterium]MBU1503881.1 (2Fe-2S)-binding protein [bacterium]